METVLAPIGFAGLFFLYFLVVCNVNFKYCEYFLKALEGFPCNTMLFFLGVSCRKQPL